MGVLLSRVGYKPVVHEDQKCARAKQPVETAQGILVISDFRRCDHQWMAIPAVKLFLEK